MKNKFLFIPLAAMAMSFASCSDTMDYNEYTIYDKAYIEEYFSQVGGFMTQLYKRVDYDFGNFNNGAMQAAATDEAEFSRLGNTIEDFYNGAWSPANAHAGNWSAMFAGISEVNHFLKDFQNLDFETWKNNADYKMQMHRYENYQYEARFMRALYYFYLVRQFGGVPLFTEVMTTEQVNSLERASSDEVFEFILKELDDIKDLIIPDYANLGEFALSETESGRASKLAVLALRGRAALYYASPLFNPTGDKERYKIAADTYKELFEACTEQKKNLCTTYANLWATDNYSKASISRELLFCYRYYGKDGDNIVETNNYPVGISGGKGGTCPSQNLVDAYETINGLAIDDPANTQYNPQDPYKNRDPRLAVTVAVNGDVWPSYQTAALQTYMNGLNGQPLTNATTTGYYLKKLLHGAIDLSSSSKYTQDKHVYLNFRLGAAYLDYAEAVFKYTGNGTTVMDGHTMSANDAVNLVRKRAKMPNFPNDLTGDAWWNKYTNERFVELAFEGHRFWDVRRWKEADKYFKSIKKLNLVLNDDGTYTYNYTTTQRQWDDKMYLYPIPQDERAKNPNLDQNPGW